MAPDNFEIFTSVSTRHQFSTVFWLSSSRGCMNFWHNFIVLDLYQLLSSYCGFCVLCNLFSSFHRIPHLFLLSVMPRFFLSIVLTPPVCAQAVLSRQGSGLDMWSITQINLIFKSLVYSLRKRSSSFTKTIWLMPRREIIALYPESYTKPVSTMWA